MDLSTYLPEYIRISNIHTKISLRDRLFVYSADLVILHTNKNTPIDEFNLMIDNKNLQKKSGGLPNQMFWAAVVVSEYLVDNGLTFVNNHGKDLDVLIYELDRHLQNRGEQDRAAAIQLFQSGKGPEPERKDYYDAWVSLPHQKLSLSKRKEELTREFHKSHSDILQTNLVALPKVAV